MRCRIGLTLLVLALTAPALGQEPTPTSEAARSDAAALLDGVEVVTEEVEQGVHRVLSDGVRDLC